MAATESKPQESEQGANDTDSEAVNQKDPVRIITLIVLAVCGLLFIWYLVADRLAPWTDQARVQAFIVPIASKVSGKIKKVHVKQDQQAHKGDLLVEIDPKVYELALKESESNLELASQEVGANTEAVVAAQAEVSEAQAMVTYANKQARRYRSLATKGIISRAESDEVTAQVSAANAQLANAEADLEKAKQLLGKEDEENARFKGALAALSKAQIDLAETKIYAPSNGGVANLQIDEGYYAKSGYPIMTFISFDDVWVTAYLRENSVANVRVGNEVDIALDSAPGRIYKGKVTSIGYGVDSPSGGKVGGLEKIKVSKAWLRDAQRFPVTIRFTNYDNAGYQRHGGQADVQIYTGNNRIINGLGWLWVRFMSLMSYVY